MMRKPHRPLFYISVAVFVSLSSVARSGGPKAVDIRAEPVTVTADQIEGLTPKGAWELMADRRRFGGLSGLIVKDGDMTAITDRGTLLTARFSFSSGHLSFGEVRLVPVVEADGSDPGSDGSDAEALVDLDGQIYAAFERDHRLAPLNTRSGVLGSPIYLPDFEQFPTNSGIEGLAAADGILLAIPEVSHNGQTPVFAIGPRGNLLARGTLATPAPHVVTDAEVGPDGMLYVVLRDFSIFSGFSIRVRRYPLSGVPPLPKQGEGEMLASFEHRTGIDNIEALSLWTDDRGRLRLWLLSDDNFSPLQRTLLLDFEVTR